MAPSHIPLATSCFMRSSSEGCGRTGILAQHRLAHGAKTDIADDVGADLLRFELRLIGSHLGHAPAIDANECG